MKLFHAGQEDHPAAVPDPYGARPRGHERRAARIGVVAVAAGERTRGLACNRRDYWNFAQDATECEGQQSGGVIGLAFRGDRNGIGEHY